MATSAPLAARTARAAAVPEAPPAERWDCEPMARQNGSSNPASVRGTYQSRLWGSRRLAKSSPGSQAQWSLHKWVNPNLVFISDIVISQ